MDTPKLARVSTSQHAADQAIVRIPGMAELTRAGASLVIERLVAVALRDGRRACRAPTWSARDGYSGSQRRSKARKDSGTFRFVWDAEETTVALVRRLSGGDWLVITVFGRTPVASA